MDQLKEQLSKELPSAKLHHVSEVHDRSSPVIEPDVQLKTWDREGLLGEIASGKELRHVQTDDHSAPVIDADAQLKPNNHKNLLQEVKSAATHRAVVSAIKDASPERHLRHVDTIDKSAPAIPADVQVKQWDKKGLLNEIEHPHQLKHVEEVRDSSQPQVDSSVHVKPSPHKQLMSEVQAAQPTLKHVGGSGGGEPSSS